MRAVLAFLLVCGACRKGGPAGPENALPEQAEAIAAQDPVAILAAAASRDDPTPRARALALLILGDHNDAGGEWGPRALFDPDPWVNRAAIRALAARDADAAAMELISGYVARSEADPYVRGHAAMVLSKDSAVAREVLPQAWREEPASWRRAPLALAAAYHGDASAVAPLELAIRGGDVALEVDFVLDLGKSDLTGLVDALREGGEVVEEAMVMPYAAARIGLGDLSAEQVFRKALSDADEEVRLEALDYLSRLDDPAAVALLRRAKTLGPTLVRWYADLALAARSGSRPDLFLRALEEDDREVRELAVRFAAEAWDAHGTNRKLARLTQRAVLQGLSDADATVRVQSLRAVAHLRLAGERQRYEQMLTDEVLAVRIEAAGTLLQL